MEGGLAVTPVAFLCIVDAEVAGHAVQLSESAVVVPQHMVRATRIAIGSYEFTSTNGNSVFAEFVGQSKPEDTPGILSIVALATIAGGTGRSDDATGTSVIGRRIYLLAGVGVGAFGGFPPLG